MEARVASSDGSGGWWVTGVSKTNQTYAMHRTAAGVWSRFPIGGWIWDLARVPGTTSLLGAGFRAAAKTGSNAVIWAYGKL